MIKHLLYLCTTGISLFLTSCIAGIERDISISAGEDAEISVEQAREFFEQELLTRNNDTPSPNILSPGDFTPQWDNAQISQNYRIACVDVPIIPTYRYRAIRSEFRRGQAQAYIVNVSQKVVIVKDRESGAMASYTMSLIPDKDFAAKHKGDISDLFLNANDRGKYSGAIFYTHHGLPVNYVHYTDGSEDCRISICGNLDTSARAENFRKIGKKLVEMKFKKTKNILSRSGEDDGNYDDDDFEGFGKGFDDDNEHENGEVDPNIPEPGPDVPPDPNEHPYPYPDPQPDPDPNPNEPLESPDPQEDGGGIAENEIPKDFNEKIGNSGFEKIRNDIEKDRYLIFKLILRSGKYMIEGSGANEAARNTIRNQYKSALPKYHSSSNAEKFGEDIYALLNEAGNYSPYWIESRTLTIIVYFDENIPFEDLQNGTVSNDLMGAAAMVRGAIDITRVNGMSKFTVGLLK